jgi:hypothetical protein
MTFATPLGGPAQLRDEHAGPAAVDEVAAWTS